MPLAPDERRAINRENARHSTGPKSADGKARSRDNALKHGLRAAVHAALPNEDPAVVEARAEEWTDYYRPQSPAARHLVDECVRATLLADRVDRYHSAELARQVREAREEWDERKNEEFVALIAALQTDPGEAVRRLRRTGLGCRAMIGLWEGLAAALAANGFWDDAERDQAVRLLGSDPSPDVAHLCPAAYSVRLNNERLRPSSAAEVARLLAPDRVPPALRKLYSAESLPRLDVGFTFLSDLAAGELDDLRASERVCREEIEGPDRAEAADCALILKNPVAARLFLRYHAEARTTFQRAYKALVQTLERDQAEADEFSPNEPTDDVASPNEPNPLAEYSPNEPITREPTRSEFPVVSPNEPNDVEPATVADDPPNEPNHAGPGISPNEPIVAPGERKSNGGLTPGWNAGRAPVADGRGDRAGKGVRSARPPRSSRHKATAR